MGSTKRRYSKEEFARRGDAIYENDVRPQLKPDDEGKFAAIDIDSGMYAVDVDELQAGDRLRARIPDAQIWMVRIGSRYVHRFGGRDRRAETPRPSLISLDFFASREEIQRYQFQAPAAFLVASEGCTEKTQGVPHPPVRLKTLFFLESTQNRW